MIKIVIGEGTFIKMDKIRLIWKNIKWNKSVKWSSIQEE